MDSLFPTQIEPREFRRALGNFPTGVVAVTTLDGQGQPLAMIIGSFASISLEPPLVGFWVDRTSKRQEILRQATYFCVNILAADQDGLCRQIAKSGGETLSGVDWSPDANGCPAIRGVIATIHCRRHQILAVGDHDLIVGDVLSLSPATGRTPLLFFKGEFGDYFSTAARLLDRLLDWQ